MEETEAAQLAPGTDVGLYSMALTLSATSHNERVAAKAEAHREARKRLSDLHRRTEAHSGAWRWAYPIQECRTQKCAR